MSSILGNSVVIGSIYHTVPAEATDGQWLPLQCDKNGRLLNAPTATFSIRRVAGANNGVLRAQPCASLGLFYTNNTGGVRYFQLFNSITAPTPGSIPVLSIRVPSNTQSIVEGLTVYGTSGLSFSLGCAFGVSTIDASFTAASNPQDYSVQVAIRDLP